MHHVGFGWKATDCRPAEKSGDRFGQDHTMQLGRRYEPRMMTSRLSSCNFGSSVSRSSKQYTRSRRPSRMPEMIPAGSSDEVMTPISSASSRRAAASGVSPRRTPPPGKCHPTRYEERTSNNAGPTYTATKVPSCRGHASRHQMRAIGKPRRKAVRQAKSRREESKVRSTTCPSRRLYIGSPLGEVNVELARRGF